MRIYGFFDGAKIEVYEERKKRVICQWDSRKFQVTRNKSVVECISWTEEGYLSFWKLRSASAELISSEYNSIFIMTTIFSHGWVQAYYRYFILRPGNLHPLVSPWCSPTPLEFSVNSFLLHFNYSSRPLYRSTSCAPTLQIGFSPLETSNSL